MSVERAERPRERIDLSATIQQRVGGAMVPLTDNQSGRWHFLKGNRRMRRLRAGAVRILGPLDLGLLQRSIESVVQRHESLRTHLVMSDGLPMGQQAVDECGYEQEMIDLSGSDSNGEAKARSAAREFFEHEIDICTEPFFATRLVRLSKAEHVLLLALDHMVGDGASCGILSKEIWTSYQQESKGLSPSLPRLPVQHGDYAVWQQQTYDARRDKDEPYWIARMAAAPDVPLPLDFPLEESQSQVGAILNLPLGKTLSNGLREVAVRERTLLPIVVLSVYLAAMSHWCRHTDWPVLFASNGRYGRAELQSMIGYLSQILRFRIIVAKSDTLTDLLKKVHQEFSSGSNHQDFVPPLAPDFNPLLVFNWGGLVTYSARWSVDQQRKAVSDIRIQPFPVDLRERAKFYPNFSDTPCGIVATVHYRPDLIAAKTLERLGHNIRVVASELQHNPLTILGSLSLE